ncbi:phenylacetate-CoA ligase [Aequitasia blattaphilus]|uniref:Phenylacetate--CoA ligase family protein n=1 Tax=Aequitasia blattaphilus TaxID=2949332 RepID=A0ABT1E609_9FIRM|nr:hypothetical protein [Aequitasia blattaphilus]MCP1101249.1 hypothetical protein [Aequitasia blattaphilus]MCR8613889.1 hypothetical protein [Aequitasia blattaphilus]
MDFRFKDYLSMPLQLLRINRSMKAAPYRNKEDFEKELLVRLREMCIYAYEHVPFYKEWFHDADFSPYQMQSFEYFERLPVLDKDVVRNNYDRLISDEAEKLGAVECETSGSTGTPMQFLLDNNVNTASLALFNRTWNMCKDWNITKPQATISGYAEGEWKYNRFSKILYLSSFHLNEETVLNFYNLILKYKVKFIRGYPSSLYRFAQLLNERNLHLQFDVMFSGAETLLPFQREFIEEFFKGKVIDHYTHWERTASICECMEGRLHAQNDYGFHEILDANNRSVKEGVGRLVCTGLYNRAMPLIRYDTRDLAEWETEISCPCGSNFPIVKKIWGRIEDIVVTPEGVLVGRLDAAFKYNKNIKLAYIYQPNIENIIVNIYPFDDFSLKTEKPLLEQELRKRVGSTIKIQYKIVNKEDIPFTPAGKVRFVVSDVDKKYQNTEFEL